MFNRWDKSIDRVSNIALESEQMESNHEHICKRHGVLYQLCEVQEGND